MRAGLLATSKASNCNFIHIILAVGGSCAMAIMGALWYEPVNRCASAEKKSDDLAMKQNALEKKLQEIEQKQEWLNNAILSFNNNLEQLFQNDLTLGQSQNETIALLNGLHDTLNDMTS